VAYIIVFSPDGKQLAAYLSDKSVRIWDAATGTTLQTFKVAFSIAELTYSSNGSLVMGGKRYNATALHEDSVLSSDPSPPLFKLVTIQPDIVVQDEWVIYKGTRMLWLHPDYRYSCSDVYGNTVCLGDSFGRVSFFEFLFSPPKRARTASLPITITDDALFKRRIIQANV
jgi:WD40 repeat protein